MSFKRDGNDSGLLSVLQKRRIKDLLAQNIPEDEAKLLSNGRFTCLVCVSHPIFDTVDMLSVHREGKKHAAGVEFHERKKAELKQLIAKRRHEQFVKTGSSSIVVASHRHTGVSTSSAYNSRLRRCNKSKPGDRKLCINLQQGVRTADPNPTTPVSNSRCVNTTSGTSTTIRPPSSSSPWNQICEQQTLSGHVKHDSQLKNIFRRKTIDEPVWLHPYVSKNRSAPTTNQPGSDVESPGEKVCPKPNTGLNTGTDCGQGTVHQGHQLSKAKIKGQQSIRSHRIGQRHCNEEPFLSMSNNNIRIPSPFNVHPPPPPPPPSPPPLPLPDATNHSPPSCRQHLLVASHTPEASLPQPLMSSSQNSLAKEYHRLQGSGWKRDWDGKWIKDQDAEFDSDEEAPDLP